MISLIVFWLSVYAVFHSYVVFPAIIAIFSKGKKANKLIFKKDQDNLPQVSILMSLFNEEEVIADKIQSIFKTSYPVEKIEILIGSDASTDGTNEILREYEQHYRNIRFFEFTQRQGKANIINKLYEYAGGEILILTDANVMFDQNTIYELVKHFKNPAIGLVDSQMININLKKSGISIQEKSYISREVKIKHHESLIWGTMMGPFGGCFAVRKK